MACDVCRLYKLSDRHLNGAKVFYEYPRLYTYYQRHRARLTLCHYHSIDLFRMGERRFLESYLRLAEDLLRNKENYVVLS